MWNNVLYYSKNRPHPLFMVEVVALNLFCNKAMLQVDIKLGQHYLLCKLEAISSSKQSALLL